MAPESLEEKHHFNVREALHAFSSTKKMGGQEFCDRYQDQLEKELEDMWQSFAKHNEVRRLFHKHLLTFMLIFKEIILYCVYIFYMYIHVLHKTKLFLDFKFFWL